MAVYEEVAASHNGARRMATVTNWAGAAVSLALLAGVSHWGYTLMVRDVTGIPVIEAAEGPMRIAPENPGGTFANHQGLSVNTVAVEGATGPLADRVQLAPRPVSLTEDDQPLTLAEAQSEDDAIAAPEVLIPASAEAQPTDLEALAREIAAGIQPLTDLEPVTETAPTAAAATPDRISPDVPGVRISLRPVLRPAGLRTASLAPVLPQEVQDIDPKTLPAGTSLVQLGAYDSVEVAKEEWDRFQIRFEAFFEGKDRVIEEAGSGGRTFYRLRAHGFAELSDARRFCAALVAGNTDCIPVVTK